MADTTTPAPPPTGAARRPGRRSDYDIAGAVWTLVRTDFLARYHGTAMGMLWALLKPLAMLAVLLFVFSIVFAATPDYPVRLVIGLLLWDYFQDGTKVGMTALAARGYLVNRSRFPRWVLIVTSTANALITLAVTSVGLITYLALAGRAPSPLRLLAYAGYVAGLVAMVQGFALAASVLFVRYRDLNQVWEVVTNAGFFLAPVIYPLDIVPERLHRFLYLWPPTSVMEFARAALIGTALPTVRGHLLFVVMTLGCLLAGVGIYRRLVPAVAEHL